MYTKLHPSTMSGTGQTVSCGGCGGGDGVESNFSVHRWSMTSTSTSTQAQAEQQDRVQSNDRKIFDVFPVLDNGL